MITTISLCFSEEGSVSEKEKKLGQSRKEDNITKLKSEVQSSGKETSCGVFVVRGGEGGQNNGGWKENIIQMTEGQKVDSDSSARDEKLESNSHKLNSHQLPQHMTEPPIIRPVTANVPSYGKVEGRREGGVDIWRGIPYAAPPVGSLRFAPPEPPQPWSPARLDASRFGPDCWQIPDPLINPAGDIDYMSEDCLHLNVFTPAGHAARSRQGVVFSGTKPLPVMVWFHGGAFQMGAARRAEYDGRHLAERDVVVVTVNYRLGALGFLVSSQDGLYGNFGLMDQRAALEWVHENIKAFGGDPQSVTLFGESAGATTIGLHLMMDGAGSLFHRAIMQSNPMGYTFRSVDVADFFGEALKHAVDCRDLACLRTEQVEEIMQAQSSFMGVPRSVGDFFTWGPTLTNKVKWNLSLSNPGRFLSRSEEHRLPRLETDRAHNYVSEWRLGGEEGTSNSARWRAANVSQPLKGIHNIPDDIPVMIGTTKHEGEIFVHSAFPAPIPKPVYWMFVGALFRDSGSRVLKHYRGLVRELERDAEELARKQIEEEEAKIYYLENREKLDSEFELLQAMNATRKRQEVASESLKTLVNAWSSGGFSVFENTDDQNDTRPEESGTFPNNHNPFVKQMFQSTIEEDDRNRLVVERRALKERLRKERQAARRKARALKEAAKVVVDYRPVMSRIIDDYLFRCPSWHYAQLLSEIRERRGKRGDNVFMYRFSQPTHIPGYKECWGKSCHTAELPYVFQAMDLIRSNYSTLGPFAQEEAPSAPEYNYTEKMAAYNAAFRATTIDESTEVGERHKAESEAKGGGNNARNHAHTEAFQRILNHFFGDYFVEDADEELASDMADRWAAFAKEGTPNYDGSKAEWFPWRNRPQDRASNKDNDGGIKEPDDWTGIDDDPLVLDEYDDVSDFEAGEADYEVIDFDETDESLNRKQAEREQRFYRRRALAALDMEVANEDVLRTELRRVEHPDVSETSFLSRKRGMEEKAFASVSKRAAEAAVRFAQDVGALGVGLRGDETGRGIGQTDPFFPELLELSWPPAGRLIERDCTCDFWDKIGYRY